MTTHRLIAKKDIHVGHNLHHGLLEELRDEGSRQIQAEDLVVLRGVFGHLQYGLHGHSEEKTLRDKNDQVKTLSQLVKRVYST